MSRRPNLIPSERINLHLRGDLYAKLKLHLWSDLEQRVPQGAYQSFAQERIVEFFSHKRLDLAPWCDSPPGAFVVSGPPEAIRRLEKALNEMEIT